MQGLLITGTDTGVGKTFAACRIVRAARAQGVRVGAYKPVCSGSEVESDGRPRWPDIDALAAALAANVPSEQICPQRFAAPLAPPAAAALEQRQVDEAQLFGGVDAWRDAVDLLIIEGVGGLLCPLSENLTVADFARSVGAPLVVVAALRLGIINHTLLTLEVARKRGLHVAGVLLNETGPDDGSHASSIAEITARGGTTVLGVLPFEPSERASSRASAVDVVPSPRPSPPNDAGASGEVDCGGEGEECFAARSAPTGEPMPAAADEASGRLRRPGLLSRIDWLGLSAEIPHF
jgi:dethiobiotin synthetase